ncbi:hypothetical protein [Microbacterium sp. No. 7]|uniref:hypothetical protein n=1 Tax=Microbacterium sp. No. 7 TaxID=1714373 RepID=UPI0006D284B6|nr:hypothetical protein [Microbacterium sp. No. 7]ALJ21112.1 hypothetical protein AOA12_14850 [Microbacterium sp. No. 7]
MTDLDIRKAASSGLERRTIVKGAAWSLPVIAVAVTTPLAAATTGTGPDPAHFFAETGCDLVFINAGWIPVGAVVDGWNIGNTSGATTDVQVTLVSSATAGPSGIWPLERTAEQNARDAVNRLSSQSGVWGSDAFAGGSLTGQTGWSDAVITDAGGNRKTATRTNTLTLSIPSGSSYRFGLVRPGVTWGVTDGSPVGVMTATVVGADGVAIAGQGGQITLDYAGIGSIRTRCVATGL